MKRLIQRGLMFGNLNEGSSQGLVERHNGEPRPLAGKTAARADCRIDLYACPPQIACHGATLMGPGRKGAAWRV